MPWKKSALFALSTAFAMAQTSAACVLTAESTHTIVRGRLVRCEDADEILRASGAYQRYERDLEVAVERGGEGNREELMRRLREAPSSPFNEDFDARIVVIELDWRASITPWVPGASNMVELKEGPHAVQGRARYWWRGSVQACEQMTALSSVDLWVYPECCDTLEFAAPVCIIEMDYAELAPASMGDAISLAIEGALRGAI